MEIVGWEKSDAAMRVIRESMGRYDAKYGARWPAPGTAPRR